LALGIKKIWLNLGWLLKEWFSKLGTRSIFSRVLLPKSKKMPGMNLGHLEGVFLGVFLCLLLLDGQIATVMKLKFIVPKMLRLLLLWQEKSIFDGGW